MERSEPFHSAMAGSNSDVEDTEDEGIASTLSVSNLRRANSVHGKLRTAEISEALKRSQSEGRRQVTADPATQLLDDKASVKKQLKMLSQVATVKDDGSVVVEVPSSAEPEAHDLGLEDAHGEAVDEELVESADIQSLPPLQIVILIVGTRGDVQPFVSIGKRLQGIRHTHVAEALKVPIHIFFTMPWTPTSEFPHPLSRVKQPAGYRISYQIVDSMIWLGIRDMINDFRKRKLKLRPITFLSGTQGRHDTASDVPHGYIWSPHLVPKPKDWGPKVDVVGFCFLDLASNYEPPESLLKWIEAGGKPIYVGFGSLPVQEPEKMTEIIVEALEITGQRGIINRGWGGLGNLAEPKEHVYLLDNVPHDWLFLQCKAVVHHGGAGTTAAGLKAACPTTVVPFFGDQPFWGDRVHARGVGPPPIPVGQFTLSRLVDAIKFMLDEKVKERAVELAKAMESEDGVTEAVKAFFKHFPSKLPHTPPSPVPSGFFGSCFNPVKGCLGNS